MLNNLRLSINESRIIGPLHVEDFNDQVSSNGSVGSSEHFFF